MGKIRTKILFIFIIIILVGSVFAGIFLINFHDEKVIKIDDLKLNNSKINMEVGENLNVTSCYTVLPKECQANVMCLLSNTKIIELSENILTAKGVGETKIYLKASGKNGFIEKDIDVVVTEKSSIPTDISFDLQEVVLGINTEYAINKINYSDNHIFNCEVSYSNPSVVDYDINSGKLTPKSIGSTDVLVTFSSREDSVTKSFRVIVKDIYREIKMDLEKEGEFYVIKTSLNSVDYLAINVFEDKNLILNSKVKAYFMDENPVAKIVQIEMSNIIIKSTKTGESVLKVYCENDPSVYIYIKIKVE